MLNPSELTLEFGEWHAQVLPRGGLLGALDCGRVPVLRRMRAGSASPLDAACFPMVPWCNRIAGGRFGWDSGVVALTPNFLPEPHAIHGHGWQAAWDVESCAADRCVLVHYHDGRAPGWPWAYTARQAIVLDEAGCTITLALTNLSERLMPAGLGLHPYLRRRPDTRVRFAAQSVVMVGPDMIPTGERRPPTHFGNFVQGAGLPDSVIDHCFDGWDGAAAVTDDCGTITLAATGAGLLHIYAPPDPAILCLEPVSHGPDAANAAAMALCAPGETVRLTLRISVA